MKKIPSKNSNGNDFQIGAETLMKKFSIGKGITEEWHKDSETGEIVILESWYVPDGECVSTEFEITEVIPQGGLVGELKRKLADRTLV